MAVKLLVLRETEKAVLTGFERRRGAPLFWLPKSQIDYDREEYAEALETKGPCNFAIPQWLIDDKEIDPEGVCDDSPARPPHDGDKPKKKFDGPPYGLLKQICEASADFLMSMDGLEVSDDVEKKASTLVGLLRKGNFFKKEGS